MQGKKSKSLALYSFISFLFFSFFFVFCFWSSPYWGLWRLCVYTAAPTTLSHLAQVGFEEAKQEKTSGILTLSEK